MFIQRREIRVPVAGPPPPDIFMRREITSRDDFAWFSRKILGEGKWGGTKYRRIPESQGDWKGRVPKCSLPRKTL